MKKLISLDAETNSLWGTHFSVAAIIAVDGKIIEEVTFLGRCPIEGEVNQWVKENVLPEMEAIPVNYNSQDEMLAAFGRWWMDHKEGATALWHMGHVVEANLFRLLVERGYIGEWDAPYTPIEVAEHLRLAGFAPDSVDGYLEERGLEKPEVAGGTHNPLYDCLVALEVYNDLQK
jgi:hypothetical protein